MERYFRVFIVRDSQLIAFTKYPSAETRWPGFQEINQRRRAGDPGKEQTREMLAAQYQVFSAQVDSLQKVRFDSPLLSMRLQKDSSQPRVNVKAENALATVPSFVEKYQSAGAPDRAIAIGNAAMVGEPQESCCLLPSKPSFADSDLSDGNAAGDSSLDDTLVVSK